MCGKDVIGTFSLLIKPSGAMCNLRCAYCFYLQKAALFDSWRMEDETLEKIVSSYLRVEQPSHLFCWQGGEPTVMGLPFFKRAVEYQKQYGAGRTVANSIQTNGTLLDGEFAAFFDQYKFLVGVSLDGPAELHDIYRKDLSGRGTHGQVLRGIRCLQEANVEYNILTLVSNANFARGRDVYRYLTGEGHRHLQFIPCVERAEYGITGGEWGRFLLDVFEEWLKGNDRYRISIRHVDSALSILSRGQTTACTTSGRCAGYFAVEHDGSVYPCDFYVEPELRLGAVSDEAFSWEKMGAHPLYRSFGARKYDWGECSACPYLALCSGDCPKHRAFTPGNPKSHLCSGWTLYYEKALPELSKIARTLTPDGILFTEKPIRRNLPCFCGSGLKAKKCHALGG